MLTERSCKSNGCPASLQLWIFGCAIFLGISGYLRLVLRHADDRKVVPERVRAALNTIAEGVLVLDREQRIALANDAFARKIGNRATPTMQASPRSGASSRAKLRQRGQRPRALRQRGQRLRTVSGRLALGAAKRVALPTR